MATYQTYQSIGNKEDITDIITNIAPMDTWFTTNSGTSKASSTYHEWQTDTLADAAANAAVEGAATSDGTVTPTVRAGNYTQIITKAFKVAKTEESVDKAGRKSEIAYQKEKHAKELARDLEYAMLVNTTAAAGSASVARTTKGVRGWIATNETDAASAALTETMLNDTLQLIWAQGGKPMTVLTPAKYKRVISAFTTNTRYMVADENKLASAVDIYQSDFGTITIRLHHILNAAASDEILILGEMDLWKKAWLRPVTTSQEPFAGDADLYAMRGEVALESRQEKGSGKITGLA